MTEYDQARCLLAVTCGRWGAVAGSALAELPSGEFTRMCRESDIHPWVHHRLLTSGLAASSAEPLMAELARLRSKVRQDNLLLLARAEQALILLTDAGVVPLVLKGLDLLHRTYDCFDQRTIDDVDLLIRRQDLRHCLELLERAGWQPPAEPRRTHYIRSSHHIPLRSPGPIPVEFEIHWNLAQDVRYHIDVDRIFERARPLTIAGRSVLRMEDHDLVAHLLVHHFSHYFDRRLKWLVDLQTLVREPTFDWDVVAERIRSWGATVSAGISLRHLKKLDDRLIPESILRDLPVGLWRRALVAPLLSSHPLELFRSTRRRSVQLYLAAVMLENPHRLPGWLLHREMRDSRSGENPLDADPPVSRGLAKEKR